MKIIEPKPFDGGLVTDELWVANQSRFEGTTLHFIMWQHEYGPILYDPFEYPERVHPWTATLLRDHACRDKFDELRKNVTESKIEILGISGQATKEQMIRNARTTMRRKLQLSFHNGSKD